MSYIEDRIVEYLDSDQALEVERRAYWKKHGGCRRCGQRETDGTTLCADCVAEMKASRKALKARRLEEGLCAYCGKPRDDLRRPSCLACREKRRRNNGPCIVEGCNFPHSDRHHFAGKGAGNGPEYTVVLCPNHHRLHHMGLPLNY